MGGGGGFAGNPGRALNPKGNQKAPGDSAGGTSPVKPGSGAWSGPRRDVQVVALKHANAVSLAKSLHELFGDGNTRVAAEQQSNSLMIYADAATSELLTKLIERLDKPTKRE